MPDWAGPGWTTAHGYGATHQRLRRAWAPAVAAGGVTCAKCGQPILRGQRWDLGHVPGSGKRLYAGPQHQRCNRDTGDERGPADPEPRGRTRW